MIEKQYYWTFLNLGINDLRVCTTITTIPNPARAFVYDKNTTGDFQPDWPVPLLANFLNSIILRWNVTQMTPFISNWIENPTSFNDFLIYAATIYYSMLCLFYWTYVLFYRYATPFGLTSEYAHPAEILFLGFATIFGPAITGPHLITLWLWMVVRVLETVEAHCGYHFPWSPSNFLPLYGGLVCTM